jgi:hypothetical protein
MLLLSTAHCYSSLFFATTREDYVIFAGDSKITNSDGTTTNRCKVHQGGSYFWAISGDYEDTGGFDSVGVAMRAMQTNGRIEIKVEAFQQLLLDPLNQHISGVRLHAPQTYQGWLNGTPILEIVVVAIEDGIPKVSVWGVGLKRDGSLNPYGTNCAPPTHGGPCEIVSGKNGAIRQWDREHPSEARQIRQNPIETAQQFINLAIKATPAEVGPPISILKITASGADWIPGFKGLCPDVTSGPQRQPSQK